ncbi:hypothetical protein LTR36_006796 [Oleoguttula mirabilis]|uniref:Carboxylic ester hydrolase n=1 Tax=Oleoguttula mirabilis TaxID=1507867 RepID=A0AAV9JB40_9PEZI|nr:hypothetical protein LTR36_006796 [Oleoguttula mirabilis]
MKLHTFGLPASAALIAAQQCTPNYIRRTLPNDTSLVSVRKIAQNGTFPVSTSDIAYPMSPTQLNELCAVQLSVSAPGNTSSGNSSYDFGLFLPIQWNDRFLAFGNDGFNGGINWLDMASGASYGFASLSTDTGHSSLLMDGSWAYQHPERLVNWGYRAMHGSVVRGKAITQLYYNSSIAYNYYSGCSTGGRQGLKEVQEFPEDFDGVVVGAPAWQTKHLQPWTLLQGKINLPLNSSTHIPSAKFDIVAAEVLRQCDPQDGVTDNIISDPRGCIFDPAPLGCAADTVNTTDCLTSEQLQTLNQLYTDYRYPNGSLIFPHLELGSEAQWSITLGVPDGVPSGLGIDYAQDFLQLGPTYNYTDYNFGLIQLADRLDPGNATADNFDLRPFQQRGGKLLHYHGLADGLISEGTSPYFYHHVEQAMGAHDISLGGFYRFFEVPGMQHCSQSPAPVNAPWYFGGATQASDLNGTFYGVPGFRDREHDIVLALMAWVEHGTAPERIVATKWVDDDPDMGVLAQRGLCPYPGRAVYDGQGNITQASSWGCEDGDARAGLWQ